MGKFTELEKRMSKRKKVKLSIDIIQAGEPKKAGTEVSLRQDQIDRIDPKAKPVGSETKESKETE